MIKAVLFDFGGVLSEDYQIGFVQKLFGKVYATRGTKAPGPLRIAALRLALRLDKISAGPRRSLLRKTTHRSNPPTVKAQGLYGLAATLRSQGIATGILSNVSALQAERLRAQGFYEGFDPVLLSCDYALAKPDRALYEAALKQLSCQPQEILFIDNQPQNLPPAQALGMHTVFAVSPGQTVADVHEVLQRENQLTFAK